MTVIPKRMTICKYVRYVNLSVKQASNLPNMMYFNQNCYLLIVVDPSSKREIKLKDKNIDLFNSTKYNNQITVTSGIMN